MTYILSEYLKLFSKYTEQYGDKTAVLMQVGHFYEVYGIENNKEKIGNSTELSRILNITLTRKNKKIAENSWSNPLMLGFPCLALKKYIDVLLEENFTIVVVDQIKTALSVNRVVRNVISPSTYIDSTLTDEFFLVLIYVNRPARNKDLHVGVSAINIQTGSSIVHECYSELNDISLSLDETISFLKQYRPREVVISGDDKINSLESYLDLESDDVLCHHIKANKIAHNVNYQNALLGNFFENNTALSNIEYLDLERRPYALISYVLLLEFVYYHNPMLLRKIYPPEIFVPLNHLVLATNTVDQLGIAPSIRTAKGKTKSTLFNVVNKCSTSLGKRLLTKRLLSPIFDVKLLENMYQQIEDFGLLFEHKLGQVEQLLGKIVDIERLQRRMSINILIPSQLASLIRSYNLVSELNVLLDSNCSNKLHISLQSVIIETKYSSMMKDFIDTCSGIFNLDNLSMCDLDDTSTHYSIFQRGQFSDIDKLQDKISNEIDKIKAVASYISTLGESDCVKVEYMQSIGYYLTISNARVKKVMHSVPHSKGIVFKPNKMITKITSCDIDTANKNIFILREDLKAYNRRCYKQVIKLLLSYSNIFSIVAKFVSSIDVIKSNYKTSRMYNYCRPVIASKNSKNSFIEAKSIRHPIIERIDRESEYVANDLSIGTGYNGMILYSMNACGKTSLLKACGLSVILAQAGCYVPASSYTFYPFKCIMTRILSEDNFMKGQSSFVAEMSELRSILKRANNRQTLILADEITHGTEHTSGSSIFISSVESLAKRKVNFMFTTHLHNVYPFVKSIPNVRVFHLSVSFLKNNTIVFERKLSDGPGSSIYGLEVCEFLDMDVDFLTRAFQIRNMITPDKTDATATIKISKYNKNKVVQRCEICNYCPKTITDMPLDVHHIKQKHLADCSGMIDGVYKHAQSNLVTLCKQCHVKTHKEKITVFGYKDTSNGKVLQYYAT